MMKAHIVAIESMSRKNLNANVKIRKQIFNINISWCKLHLAEWKIVQPFKGVMQYLLIILRFF